MLQFLNNTNKSIPIQNSKAAKAIKKNDNEYKFKSSVRLPKKIESINKTTHTISENNNKSKKLN